MQYPGYWTAGGRVPTLERNLDVPLQQSISTNCTSAKPSISGSRSALERQELSCSCPSFLDSISWWEFRENKKGCRAPVCRHEESKERLWLNNLCKPEWLNLQLTVLDKQIREFSYSRFDHTSQHTAADPQREGHITARAVSELCGNGQLSRAVDILTSLVEEQSRVSTSLLYQVIRTCGAEKNLVLARRLDDLVVKLGYGSNAFLGCHLLRMYARKGRLEEAMQVFRRIAQPSVYLWFSIISAQAKHGSPSRAIELYHEMRKSGLEPDGHIFVAVLQACARARDLKSGRQVHADVLERITQPDSFVCNCLVDMYAKCGELDEARRMFDSMSTRDVVAWTAMIAGYAKCGKLEDARTVFDSMDIRTVVTWNAMIAGYAEHGLGDQALAMYARMEQEGLILANRVTYICLLKACAVAGALQQGKQLHARLLEKGLVTGDTAVGTSLVNMYAKCGKLADAQSVFDNLVTKDAVSWNAMISGYAEHGFSLQALTLHARMEQEGVILSDNVTYTCLLKACASAGTLQRGRQLHSQILGRGLLKGDVVMGACLVNMYAKCGELEEARNVFDRLVAKNAVTWTAMINGYAEQGLGPHALTLYSRMEQEGLILADSVTFACLLKACASAGALEQGRQLHSEIMERGLLEGDSVMTSSLVDMYAKCGKVEDARLIFDSVAAKNSATWAAMINAYAEHGLGSEALKLYARMETEGLILADCVTFVCLLKACASAGALQQGKQLHSQILRRGLLYVDIVVGTCLVNMYAKCGKMEEARMVFDDLKTRNAVTWTAMINGYGTNNEGHKAIACFEEMILAGVPPDATTFTCLLVACSHEGLVSKGQEYFDAMVKKHGLDPTVEHYTCLVDLLGRAGRTDEAENVLLSAGCGKDVVGLTSLLSSCKSHGDVERGVRCFESLIELDPQNAAAYVLMASLYAYADRWADVDRVETLRMLARASKKPAVAGIEVNNQVHTFVVGEERDDVACKARSTNLRLQEEGNHVPHTEVVLKSLSVKEKEDQLCGHAEKLALAYGLLNTPEGTPLLVTKNLRMCRDCHSSTEIMSRVEKRDIVVRDSYCVHRFEAGSCSCKGRH